MNVFCFFIADYWGVNYYHSNAALMLSMLSIYDILRSIQCFRLFKEIMIHFLQKASLDYY